MSRRPERAITVVIAALAMFTPAFVWAQNGISVSRLSFSKPVTLATIDSSELTGMPSRLAWSPDRSALYLQTLDGAFGSPEATPRHHLVDVVTGAVTAAAAEPEWAATYWAAKSGQSSPDPEPLKIDLKSEQRVERTTSVPRGGDLARGGTSTGSGSSIEEGMAAAYTTQPVFINTMSLHGEQIAEFYNTVIVPGLTFGWGPPGARLIVYAAPKGGRVTVMDESGKRAPIGDTKDALLPAWAPDGSRIVWLEKDGRRGFVLRVSEVR